jgi:hypothetical protein
MQFLKRGAISRLRERKPMLTLNRVPATAPNESITGGVLMDAPNQEFALAGSLEELKAKGRLVVHGGSRGPQLLPRFLENLLCFGEFVLELIG